MRAYLLVQVLTAYVLALHPAQITLRPTVRPANASVAGKRRTGLPVPLRSLLSNLLH